MACLITVSHIFHFSLISGAFRCRYISLRKTNNLKLHLLLITVTAFCDLGNQTKVTSTVLLSLEFWRHFTRSCNLKLALVFSLPFLHSLPLIYVICWRRHGEKEVETNRWIQKFRERRFCSGPMGKLWEKGHMLKSSAVAALMQLIIIIQR